jgi:hypothetical protein
MIYPTFMSQALWRFDKVKYCRPGGQRDDGVVSKIRKLFIVSLISSPSLVLGSTKVQPEGEAPRFFIPIRS